MIVLEQLILFKFPQLANAFLDTEFTRLPKFTFDKLSQPANALLPIDWQEFEILIDCKLSQFLNALFATLVTLYVFPLQFTELGIVQDFEFALLLLNPVHVTEFLPVTLYCKFPQLNVEPVFAVVEVV